MARNPLPYLVNPPTRGHASLINRVRPTAKPSETDRKQGEKKMAKKRRSAAQKAATKKMLAAAKAKRSGRAKPARKARKARKARRSAPKAAAPRKVHRKRHQVKRYHRSGGHVKSYRRRGANVKQHWSNPFGQSGQVAIEGLVAAGAILGTLLVVGMANRQLQRFAPTQAGWGNIAGKLALAIAAGTGARMLYKRRMVSRETAFAMTGAAMAPLLLGGVAMFAPQIAGQVGLAAEEMPMNEGGMAGVVEYGAVGAELQAELQAQLESDADEVESGII